MRCIDEDYGTYKADLSVEPKSAGLFAILHPAAVKASNLAAAVPLPPLIIAPA